MKRMVLASLAIVLLLFDALFSYTLWWEQVHESGSATTTPDHQLFVGGMLWCVALLTAVLSVWLLHCALNQQISK